MLATPKPVAPKVNIEGIPDEIKELAQWCVWKYDLRENETSGEAKWTKPPLQAKDPERFAKSNDPATWATFNEAHAAYLDPVNNLDGIGFVLSASDPFVGVDFDHCLSAKGELLDWAKPFFLLHSYTEVSPSGRGLKFFIRGSLPKNKGRVKKLSETEAIELYKVGRYFTVTGIRFAQAPSVIHDCGAELDVLCRQLFPEKPKPLVAPVTNGMTLEDWEIIELCRKAKNATKFSALFDHGSLAGYGSQNQADQALAGILSFYTDDAPQLERLLSASALGQREKWTSRADYRASTISFAFDHKADSYAPPYNGQYGEQGNRKGSRNERSDKSERSEKSPKNGASVAKVAYVAPAKTGEDPEKMTVRRWPKRLGKAAYFGLAGSVVKALGPHTESDPVAILIQLIVGFGNLVGRTAHFSVEADSHYANLFACLVGPSSKARKGTSWGHVKRILSEVDAEWARTRILSGLSSGEGLIWAVRDKIVKQEPVKEKGRVVDYQEVEADPGISDKRLLALEPELASPLKNLAREGNVLSAIIRRAWDDGNLRTLTKQTPAVATDAHISIVGHITRDELERLLNSTEAANGFGNRFLWCCVRRSRSLPFGGQAHAIDFGPLMDRLAIAASLARTRGRVERDGYADQLWMQVYDTLAEGKPGLLGAILGRAEAQVARLSLVYALLDSSAVITREHLEAALELWRYCEESALYCFGDSLGDGGAYELLDALKEAPDGLTQTEICHDVFSGHRPRDEVARALGRLSEMGRAYSIEDNSTGGRPVTRWFYKSGQNGDDSSNNDLDMCESLEAELNGTQEDNDEAQEL